MHDDDDCDCGPQLPRYLIVQHRGEMMRFLALVSRKSTARKLVLSETKLYSGEDEYFVVLDSRCDEEGQGKVVGTCCHPRYDLVILEEGEAPKLMPVEIARLFEHEEGVTFLTDNRKEAQ